MTLILSNTQAVQAVAQTWLAMITVAKKYKEAGRGFLYHEYGDEHISYMDLSELRDGIGKEHLGIDEALHQQLIEVVETGYNFDNEFVFVVKRVIDENTNFTVNIGSLRDDGWTFFNSPEHIKAVEKETQRLAAKRMLEHLKRQRKRMRKP